MITLHDPDSIRKSLTDPTGPSIKDIELLVKHWDNDSIPDATKGLAGLLLLCATTESSIRESVPSLKPAAHYLADPTVTPTLYAEYGVPQDLIDKIDDLKFHEVGTTSVILRSGSAYVLKIIKPWFWSVASISQATKDYRKRFGQLGSVCPLVYKSDPKWIFMSFIEGTSLTKYIKNALHPLRSNKDKDKAHLFVSQVQDIFTKICDALKTCLASNIHHLDLSPDNVIVTPEDGPVERITLIDFGINYLLLTHLGTGTNLSRANTFIPPELQHGAQGDALSDVYSLGLILLEMLAPDALSDVDPAVQLDDVWDHFPQVAAIVEDMIDQQPPNRLLQNDDSTVNAFVFLKQSLIQAITLHKQTKLRPTSLFDVPSEIINSAIPWTPVRTAWEQYRDSAKHCDQPLLLWVLLWGFGAQILHILVMCLIIWTTWHFADSRLCDTFHCCSAGENVPPLPFWNGALSGTINGYTPGRLIALTFALIFSRYYSEVFGLITVRYFKSSELQAKARVPELAMRSVPVLGFLCLVYGLVVDPKAWAFCAAFGLVVVSVTNGAMYRFCQWAVLKASDSLKLPPSRFVADQLEEFERWRTGIFIYAISLFVLGFCMFKGVAKDEWLYAVLAGLFVNLGVIYRIHCTKRPPHLRTAFVRVLFRLRRVDTVLSRRKERSGRAEVESAYVSPA